MTLKQGKRLVIGLVIGLTALLMFLFEGCCPTTGTIVKYDTVKVPIVDIRIDTVILRETIYDYVTRTVYDTVDVPVIRYIIEHDTVYHELLNEVLIPIYDTINTVIIEYHDVYREHTTRDTSYFPFPDAMEELYLLSIWESTLTVQVDSLLKGSLVIRNFSDFRYFEGDVANPIGYFIGLFIANNDTSIITSNVSTVYTKLGIVPLIEAGHEITIPFSTLGYHLTDSTDYLILNGLFNIDQEVGLVPPTKFKDLLLNKVSIVNNVAKFN